MSTSYSVGQSWVYEAPKGFEGSRIIIGAILTFNSHEPVICAAVTGAPMKTKKGDVLPLTIPFLPFSKTAFDQTVLSYDGSKELPASFGDSYQSWKTDRKGLGFIDIPFKGLLRNMVDGLDEKAKMDQEKCNPAAKSPVGQIACIEDH